jgi:macrolide transport system ATP-binding/permease protein
MDVNNFMQDLRYAARMLAKTPGFTAVAILTLALGIGANTAIFSMVNSFLLRPLPVKDSEQITALAFQQKKGALQTSFSIPELHDIQRDAGAAFSGVFGFEFAAGGITTNGKTQPIVVNYVTGDYFTALGLKPELGRFIEPSEGDPATVNPVLVLGYNYWKTRLGADPNIVGKTVSYNGHPATIIGVVPREFHGTYAILDTQGYLPLGMATLDSSFPNDSVTNREVRNLILLARMRPGVQPREAQSVLNVVSDRLSKQNPKSEEGMLIEAFPERLSRPQPDLDNTLVKIATLFLILAALVLLLACVNVANFLLVRATVRQREMAIRAALGGSRARLIRQLLTESVLLALGGGAAGVLLGLSGSSWLSSSVHLHTALPVMVDFQFDWRVFLYGFGAALATGIFVGIVPAVRASNGHMLEVIREGGRTMSAGHSWLRSGLVVAQVGGSLMLLIVAGLMTRSLAHVRRSDLGFEPAHILNLTLDPSEIGYSKEQGLAFFKQAVERVESMPGVQSASVAFSIPMGYYSSGDSLEIPGYEQASGEAPPSVGFNQVTPHYFRTMGIPVLQGREFEDKDQESAQRVAIVNEAMVARFWPKESPIGHEFKMVGDRAHSLRIVGVVKNSRTTSLTGPMGPFFFVPFAQNYTSLAALQVRTTSDPERMAEPVREQIEGLAPSMPIVEVREMQQSMETLNGFLIFEMAAGLAGGLGFLGLILAVVGVFGVISFSVSQRTHEIGIRMALGAGSRSVLQMILQQGAVIVGVGLALGILLAFGMARLVGNFLEGVSPFDPLTYVCVTLSLALVALLASYIPARRATLVDPMVALRYE